MMESSVDELAALALARVRARRRQPEKRPLHPHQIPPSGDWDVWLLLGGRGSGKTEAGARATDAHANGPACIDGSVPHRIAVIAPSHDDAVDTCVRGETGLLQANPLIRFRPGSALLSDLTWPNGAEAELFGTFGPEDVERFRGPQHCWVWWDEFAAARKLDDSWDMVQFGLRLGSKPRMVLTTTPKRRPKLKTLLASDDVAVTKARTDDNPDLPQHRRDALYRAYGGTTIGRQELDAEIIEDVQGALWKREIIIHRQPDVRVGKAGEWVPDLVRIVVAIDPAVTSGEDADETGIVVDAVGADGNGYTLADLSGRMAPAEWAKRAVKAYQDYGADRIVAEANNGGDLVSTVIRAVDPIVPISLVHAAKGKRTRAEPVAALYEQGRWFHAEPMPDLEDQMCSYTGAPGEDSPDRMDAHVWGASELFNIQVGDGTWGSGKSWGTAA